MGFVGDLVGGVVDIVGDVAGALIDNALPIIETVAFDYFVAPGFGSLISEGFDISANIAGNIASGIGHAAISAANGGSLASIAAAGLAPVLASSEIQEKVFGGAITGPNGVINSAVGKVISDPTLSKIVSGAVGQAGAAGIVAGITGGDIIKAATTAGLSSAVSQSLGGVWNTVKASTPSLENLQNDISDKSAQVKDVLPTFQKASEYQDAANSTAQEINTKLAEYNECKAYYDDLSASNGSASAIESYRVQANTLANEINNTLYPKYESQLGTFNSFMEANNAAMAPYTSIISDLSNSTSQYNLLTTQINADYSQYAAINSIRTGDFTQAANFQKQFDGYNSYLTSVDPSAVVGHQLDNQQIDLLNQINNAPDEATRNQLISQAKLNQGFADIMNSPEPDYSKIPAYTDTTTPTTDTTTSTGTTNTSTDTNATQQTTPPPSKVDVSKLQPTPTNIIQNVLSNAIKQGIVSNIVGGITGGNTSGTGLGTGTQPKPTVQSPAKHVDVSTLKPFTGTLPTGLSSTTPTTPTSPTTTQTGGLGTTTNTTQTPTQTANSGLQSVSQPQVQAKNSPAKHVDISTLTPVTNNTQLANLGLNIG
jgi:hypothetical protein